MKENLRWKMAVRRPIQSNVRRCCVMNSRRNTNKRTGAVNSDHKYMGFRFYFESDNIWTTKVKTT